MCVCVFQVAGLCDALSKDNTQSIIVKHNTEIRAMAGMETVESMMRLRWLGHMARMDHSRVQRLLMVCRPEGGKRVPGGQKHCGNDIVTQDLKKEDLLTE